MYHAAQLSASATAHVDHGTHGGSGTGNAAEQAADHVANALAYQLAIAVMVGFGDIVGHHRSEQRVYGAEAGERESGNDGGFQHHAPVQASQLDTLFGKERHRQTRRDSPNGQLLRHIEKQRHHRHHDESHQSGRYLLGQQRKNINNGDSAKPKPKGGEADAAAYQLRKLGNHIDG